MQVTGPTQSILHKLDAIESRMEAHFDQLNGKIDALRWFIGAAGLAVCVFVKVFG